MKIHNQFIISLSALSLFSYADALAQSKGRIVDAQGEGIAFANVVALSKTDSTVVAACVSNEKGYYKIPTQANVKYELLRVSALGYEPLYYNCTTPIELLQLTLKPLREVALAEANVVYKRPVAHIDNGAIVTNIQGTTLSKVGNAEDVLRQVPGIIKKNDKDGTIEVIGSGEPQVYLNGRILRDLNELKQLPSEDIKSVEVINTPGANYDASVKAVVKIKTIKRKGEGWGVNLSNNFMQGKYAYNHTSLRINYQKNGLNVAVGGEYDRGRSYWISQLEQQTQANDTLWVMPTVNPSINKFGSFREFAEINYDFSDKHSVGMRYQLKTNAKYPAQCTVESDVMANGEYYDRLVNTIYTEDDDKPQHALNAYYVGQWGKGEFRIDADFFANGGSNTTRYDEKSDSHESRNFPTINDTRNRLVYAKMQYEWPWLKGKVTIGGQFNHTNRHDNYHVDNDQYGVSSSSTHLLETTEATYVQYATMIAKKVKFSAGLRYEHLQLKYYNSGKYIDEQSPTYNNLFPSLNAATQLGNLQLMLAYTSQTDRPNYNRLSSNMIYGNRFLLTSGNPNLKAAIKHNISVTAVYNWVQFNLKFNHTKDDIIYWGKKISENSNITKVSFINHNTSNLDASVMMSPKIKFWNPTVVLNLTKDFFNSEPLLGHKLKQNPILYADFTNTFSLPKGYDFTIDYSLTTRGAMQNVRMYKVVHYLECYLSKSFLKDALTLTIGGNDLLKKSNSKNRIYMDNTQIFQSGYGDTRNFYLKLNYTFNAMRNKYKSDSDVNEVIKRL